MNGASEGSVGIRVGPLGDLLRKLENGLVGASDSIDGKMGVRERTQ